MARGSLSYLLHDLPDPDVDFQRTGGVRVFSCYCCYFDFSVVAFDFADCFEELSAAHGAYCALEGVRENALFDGFGVDFIKE